MSDVLATVSRVAVQMGEAHCPGGFRLVSNFGPHAMQSQVLFKMRHPHKPL